MKKNLGIVIIVILVLGGIAYFLEKHNEELLIRTTQKEKPQLETPKRIGPNYSGITIKKMLTYEIKKGNGQALATKSEFLADIKIFIYDPGRLGNRGDLVYHSEKQKKFNFRSEPLFEPLVDGLKRMAVGDVFQFVVPADVIKDRPKELKSYPDSAIYLVDVKVIN